MFGCYEGCWKWKGFVCVNNDSLAVKYSAACLSSVRPGQVLRRTDEANIRSTLRTALPPHDQLMRQLPESEPHRTSGK